MDADKSRVIVSLDETSGGVQVHHRDFPEIRASGQSPADAATQLVNQLTRALDSALTNWRRESMQHAIADVQAFAARPRPEREPETRSKPVDAFRLPLCQTHVATTS